MSDCDVNNNKLYAAIDLKSFYASVECVERGLDPFNVNLVVADITRTEKTICLAVSPALKKYGIPGRARLFEVIQKVKQINTQRRAKAPGHQQQGSSIYADELSATPQLALDYLVVPPQMAHYMEFSTKIYSIYLKYIQHEDIHVYSIDEVFMDITDYTRLYQLSARELVMKMILDVVAQTGITATAGIGTNMYLAKIAMDVRAKHIPADKHGVRIAQLDEASYRHLFWAHRPITDFWRIGHGTAARLEKNGLFTLGDIAMCSVSNSRTFNEDLLYKIFGKNAELLIDHAWGWEPCTIAEIKAYKPSSSSTGSGQVLQHPYPFEKARLVIREMADSLVLDLVEKGLSTDKLVLTVGYDIENLTDPNRRSAYTGPVTTDRHGRSIPKPAHGTANLGRCTSSTRLVLEAVTELFDSIVDSNLLVRRLNLTANIPLGDAGSVDVKSNADGSSDAYTPHDIPVQLDLFTDYEEEAEKELAQQFALQQEKEELAREEKQQKTVLEIKKRFGKNAIVRGMNLEEGATSIDRNGQIGGHKA